MVEIRVDNKLEKKSVNINPNNISKITSIGIHVILKFYRQLHSFLYIERIV